MILGYDTKRPSTEDYLDFEEQLISEFSRSSLEGSSIMLYGSYVRKEYDAGRSDIGAVLIFSDDVIINKLKLLQCSNILSSILTKNYIPFQVSVNDLTTLKDGRFTTYGEDFEDYFRKERKIIVGPDYFNQITFMDEKSGVLHIAAFNLRKSRTDLLFSKYHQTHKPETLIKNFERGLSSALNTTKQIAYLTNGELIKNKFNSIGYISDNYPKIKLEVLAQIRYLFKNPTELDSLYLQPDSMITLWTSALNTSEELIREYIKQNPLPEIPTLTEVISK